MHTCRVVHHIHIIINYIIIILTLFVFAILEGKVYDPADITIVNKPNGVEENDIPIGFLEPASAIRLP